MFAAKILPALLCAFLFLALPSSAAYKVIHTEPVRITDLAPGVRHELHQIFTDEGWIVVNLVRSKTDAKKSLVPLYSKGDLTSSKTLSEFTDERDGIVAAINGDYYDYRTRAVLGRIVDRGEIVQSSNRDARLANFYVCLDGKMGIGHESSDVGRLVFGRDSLEIDYVNKAYTDWDNVLLFDRNFGENSPQLPTKKELVVQVLVKDYIAKKVIQNDEENQGESLEIPDGGVYSGNFVIYAQGADANKLLSSLQEGDGVRVVFNPLPFTSISGGAQLVKDGKSVEEFSHNVLGEHPRTAIGIEKDGKTVMFVTVNGRSNSYRGIRQSELAELMIRLGAYNAIVLDGGGSTEMLIVNPYRGEREIVSFLSDGAERQIFNALSIRSEKKTKSDAIFKLRFSQNKMNGIVGVPMKLDLEAIDKSYQNFEMDGRGVVYEAIGIKGVFKDGFFIPSASGDGVISASLNGVKAYADVHISARVIKLEAREKGGKYRFYLHSEDGYSVEVGSASIKASIPSNLRRFDPVESVLIPVEEGVPGEERSGYVTFSYTGVGGEVVTANLKFGPEKRQTQIENFESYDLTKPGRGGIYLKISPHPSGEGKAAAVDLAELKGRSDEKRMRYFPEHITIPKEKQTLVFDLYASKKGNIRLDLYLSEREEGDSIVPILDGIDWEGWKTIKIENLKKGDSFKILAIQTNQRDGILYFDNFRIEGQDTELKNMPDDIDFVKRVTEYRIESSSPTYLLSYIEKEKEDEKEEEDSKIEKTGSLEETFHFLEIENRGGYIRRHNGFEQWKDLLETLRDAKKPVLIKFTGTYFFPDKMAMNLLFQAVESCPQPVFMLFKAYRDQTDIFMHRGAQIIEIKEKSETLKISEDLQFQIIDMTE